jgi:tetratricopeptide (TPR) repeat protein
MSDPTDTPRSEPAAPGARARRPDDDVAGRETALSDVLGRDTPTPRRSWLGAALAGRVRGGPEQVHLSLGAAVPGTRYRLVRWLGEGGMGVVFEAVHIDIERRVAVKILRPEVCDQPRALQLFRDEARTAGKIGSAHIVEILDFAELPDGRLLYAMELLSGRSLARELAERPLAPARAIAILRQTCKGLASAHAAHIVHRDIKPDNLFLCDRQSRPDAVKIVDFGISIFMVEATVTDTSVVGTPMYLAPEIIAGKPFDARVDIYAVGCTAYEMLTGRPPYQGTIKELLVAHVHAPRPTVTSLVRDHDVPEALAAVVVRCLAKRPEDRYADMHDLEAALCEAQIAARLETAWDDLSLPEVEGERRDLLLRGMPDPAMGSLLAARPRRRSHLALALLAAALLAGSAAVLLRAPAAPAAADPQLARLEADARAAAARVAFVYPPADDPNALTAYQAIRALEGLHGPRRGPARELARALRREFAGTLGAFGDRLWARPGGLEFAVDAYAQALLFDPDHEPAASRAELTPGQLARLAAKAAANEFSESELIAVEPLVVLADAELAPDSPALQQARERAVRRTRDRSGALARLTGDAPRGAAAAEPASDAPVADPTPASDAPVSDPTPASDAPVSDPTPASDTPLPAAPAPRDPTLVPRLLAQARAAVREGRPADAEKLYERVLAQDGRSAEALAGLTELYFNRGAYQRALGFGGRALRLAPDDAALHLLVGDAAFKAFRLDDARSAYVRAGELGHPEAAKRLAKLDARRADGP